MFRLISEEVRVRVEHKNSSRGLEVREVCDWASEVKPKREVIIVALLKKQLDEGIGRGDQPGIEYRMYRKRIAQAVFCEYQPERDMERGYERPCI